MTTLSVLLSAVLVFGSTPDPARLAVPGEAKRIVGAVEIGTVAVSATGTLNVRSRPGGEVIGCVRGGEQVEIHGRVGDWLRIRRVGSPAYVHAAYVIRDGRMHVGPDADADDGFDEETSSVSVDLRSSSAVRFGKERQHSYRFSGYCLRFVARCYGAQSSGYRSARLAFEAIGRSDSIVNFEKIPLGALVFFSSPRRRGQRLGHVGINLGGGRMLDAAPRVGVRDFAVSIWRDRYLGWAVPPDVATTRIVYAAPLGLGSWMADFVQDLRTQLMSSGPHAELLGAPALPRSTTVPAPSWTVVLDVPIDAGAAPPSQDAWPQNRSLPISDFGPAPGGRIFVADPSSGRLLLFRPNGSLETSLVLPASRHELALRRPSGPHPFAVAFPISTPEVYLLDLESRLIHVFSFRGESLRILDISKHAVSPRALRVTRRGDVLVLDRGLGRVLRFTARGDLDGATRVGHPTLVETGAGRLLGFGEERAGRIDLVEMDPNGRSASRRIGSVARFYPDGEMRILAMVSRGEPRWIVVESGPGIADQLRVTPYVYEEGRSNASAARSFVPPRVDEPDPMRAPPEARPDASAAGRSFDGQLLACTIGPGGRSVRILATPFPEPLPGSVHEVDRDRVEPDAVLLPVPIVAGTLPAKIVVSRLVRNIRSVRAYFDPER